MKQFFSIFLVAFIVSACQSTPESKGNMNTPSNISAVPTHNPAHGQPYHDCSIAVGAPLVSKQPVPVKPVPVKPVPVKPAPVKEITRNPAHGMPGHRCDIPVGAPLT